MCLSAPKKKNLSRRSFLAYYDPTVIKRVRGAERERERDSASCDFPPSFYPVVVDVGKRLSGRRKGEAELYFLPFSQSISNNEYFIVDSEKKEDTRRGKREEISALRLHKKKNPDPRVKKKLRDLIWRI